MSSKIKIHASFAHICNIPCFIVNDGSCSSTYPITLAGIPATMLGNPKKKTAVIYLLQN